MQRRLIKAAAIFCGIVLVLGASAPVHAVAISSGPLRLSGGRAGLRERSLIYRVELNSPNQELLRITIQIDGAEPDPITASDIRAIRMYADTDGTGGLNPAVDLLLGSATGVRVGAPVDVLDPAATQTIPAGGMWFFVTIEFYDSASLKYFRVSAPTPPDNIEVQGPPPVGLTVDGGIGPGQPVQVGSFGIPVGHEWLVAPLLLAYGIYRLRKKRTGGELSSSVQKTC